MQEATRPQGLFFTGNGRLLQPPSEAAMRRAASIFGDPVPQQEDHDSTEAAAAAEAGDATCRRCGCWLGAGLF